MTLLEMRFLAMEQKSEMKKWREAKFIINWPVESEQPFWYVDLFLVHRIIVNFHKQTIHFRFPQSARRGHRENSVLLCVLCVSVVKSDGL